MTDTINRRRFPILLVTTLALLAILGALFLPGAAQAQSRNTYTSNLGEDTDTWDGGSRTKAQAFHTGNEGEGYKLESVQIKLRTTGTNRGLRVWLYDEFSDGKPGQVIFEFVARDIPSGTNNVRFDAPGGARIEPDTDYYIVWEPRGDSGSIPEAAQTEDHDQQEFSGWWIHNVSYHTSGGSWDDDGDNIYQISVRGFDADDEPYVTSTTRVGAPAGGVYQAGDEIFVNVLFSEAVDVDVSGGKPRVPLTIGSATRYADYHSKSAASITFSYTVQIGDYDADGFHVDDSSLELNGGTIKRANSSVNADLDHPALAADSDYAVDARATAPDAPTGLTATALGATIVDLAWTAPADGGSAITGYKVEVSNDGSSGWSNLEDDTGNANAWYRHTGLSNGDTRHYRVSAINAQGTSPASASDDATTMTGDHHAAPADIYGDVLLSAEMTVGTVPGGLGYITGPPEAGSLSSGTFEYGGTTFTLRSILLLPAGDILSFGYSAPLGSGLFTLHLGPFSDEFAGNAVANSITLPGFTYNWQHGDTVDVRLVLATAPAKPTGLSATAAGNAQIDLAWTAPPDDGGRAVSGYKVEVSDDGSTGSWSDLVADTGSTDTAYSHSGLSAGDTRHYRVSAINAAGTSEASDSDEATTRLTVPDPPAGVAAIADGTSKIVVSWREPANTGGSAVTGYKVQASENGVSDWSTLVQNTTDTSYTHSGLSAGATRHYRVYARNAQGESQPSDVVSDTTQPTATTCTEGPDDLWCGVVTVGEIILSGVTAGHGFSGTSR